MKKSHKLIKVVGGKEGACRYQVWNEAEKRMEYCGEAGAAHYAPGKPLPRCLPGGVWDVKPAGNTSAPLHFCPKHAEQVADNLDLTSVYYQAELLKAAK
jgi:hypothetical protein